MVHHRCDIPIGSLTLPTWCTNKTNELNSSLLIEYGEGVGVFVFRTSIVCGFEVSEWANVYAWTVIYLFSDVHRAHKCDSSFGKDLLLSNRIDVDFHLHYVFHVTKHFYVKK